MAQYIEYLRKSQMDRDFDDVSVEETLKRHRKILDEFTRRKKLNVTVILEEVVSAELLSSRPQMMKALELVNTGEYDGIVCMDIDRISRGSSFDSGYIMQILQVNDCKIITPDKTYDLRNESDEQFADMKFMFSRYELRTITKRLVNGRNASASEGKFLGGLAPYGYNIYKLKGEKGNTLEINPEEARVVKMIFDLYTKENMGYNTIAYTLNNLHLKTKTGLPWTMRSVYNVLSNVVYTGKIRWKYSPQEKRVVDGKLVKKRVSNKNYEIHKGLHEPIISDEQFELAQRLRSTRYNPSVKINKEIANPFAGMMFCEKCGSVIKRNTHGQRKVKPRYRCPKAGKECDCKGHVIHEVEEAVVNAMKEWLNGYLLTLNVEDIVEDDSLETALDLLQNELEDLQKQQDNICELLEKEVYTIQMFTKRNNALQVDIDRVTSSIEDLKEQIFNQQKEQVIQSNIIPATQYLLDSYDKLTPREKNDLWKEVLEKVTYYKAETKGEFYITIYPRLQKNPPQTQ